MHLAQNKKPDRKKEEHTETNPISKKRLFKTFSTSLASSKKSTSNEKGKPSSRTGGFKHSLKKQKGYEDNTKKKKKHADTRRESANSVEKAPPKMDRKICFLQREIVEQGTWVQCDNATCRKWRFLADVTDPSVLTSKWTCNLNSGKYSTQRNVFTIFIIF